MRIKWNMAGFRALRTSQEAQRSVSARAQRVAAAAGPGVEVLPTQSPQNRSRALVGPVTAAAARRIAEDPAQLVRALEAGRQ